MKLNRNDPETILNSLAGALITTDIHGIITMLNRGAEDLTGYKEGELLGKSVGGVFQIIDLPTASGYGNIVEFVINKGKVTWQVGDAKLITGSGKEMYVSGSAAPVFDSGGNTSGVVMIINDPADSSKAEEQFQESERRFRSLYENATLGMYRTTPDGRILLANPALVNMLGYSSFKELKKRSLEKEGYEPDYKREDFKKLMERNGEVIGFESAWTRMDGTSIFIRESAKAIKDEAGNTICYEGTVEDITERKKAEEKLKISEKTLRLFVEFAPAAIAMFDRNMNYIAASHRYITDYRLRDENIIGRSHYEIFPEMPERWKEIHRRCLEGAVDHDEEDPFPREDGTVDWVRWEIYPWYEKPDEVGGLLLFSEVITERKLAGEKLRASEARFSSIFKFSPVAIGISRVKDQMIINVNASFCNFYGFTAEEAIGHTTEELGIWKNIEERHHFVELLTREGHISGLEATSRLRSGAERQVLVWGELLDINDEPCMMAQVVDITERKQAELALRSSEEKYRTLTESFESVIITVDADGIIHYANQTAAKAFDVTPEMLTGRNMYDLFPGKMAEHQMTNIRKVISGHKGMVNEAQTMVRGEMLWYRTSIQPLADVTGEVHLALVNAVDISEIKEAEKKLITAKEKAEENDRLKSAFLTNVSHEIRTPMNGILGFTELLETPDLPEDARAEYIDIIKQSGDRMLNTINDLIEISSIETGVVAVMEGATNVNELLYSLFNFFELQSEQKGLQLYCNTSLPDEKAIIITDKNKLDSILTNLIRNAIKFTQKGSVEFGYKPKSRELEFYVSDTGGGIPADRISAVFERFVQGDIRITRPYEGSGLGLSITKAYVEMLGGSIHVESKEKEGSVFRFTIPWKPKEGEKSTKISEDKTRRDNLLENSTILVVEDDDVSFIYLARVLERTGSQILRADSGQEAIKLCRTNSNIDIVLMDIKMPGMDGYEATGKIREFNKELIIIAQTANAFKDEHERALAAGCNDYIAKPYDPKALLEVLTRNI